MLADGAYSSSDSSARQRALVQVQHGAVYMCDTGKMIPHEQADIDLATCKYSGYKTVAELVPM